jgi:adenylate cyclase
MAIAPQIDVAEQDQARRRRSENLSAYDRALRAGADGKEAYQNADFALWERSLAEAREALALDPRSNLALSVIAGQQARYLFMFMGTGTDEQMRWREGAAAAAKMIEFDPSGSLGYSWMGMLLSLGGRGAEALTSARRGHELNRNDVSALLALGYIELFEGLPQQALDHLNLAVRISPRDPWLYQTNVIRAGACFLLREHAKGLEYSMQAIQAAPNWPPTQMTHVLVCVGAGDIVGAAAALDAARRLAPDYVRRRLEGASAYSNPADRERTTLAFRVAAGLVDRSLAKTLQ